MQAPPEFEIVRETAERNIVTPGENQLTPPPSLTPEFVKDNYEFIKNLMIEFDSQEKIKGKAKVTPDDLDEANPKNASSLHDKPRWEKKKKENTSGPGNRTIKLTRRSKPEELYSQSEGEDKDEEDDLTGPYQRKAQSRFTRRIAQAPKPDRLRMPTHMKTYDGSGDPDDHLSLFCAAAENNTDWTMPVWCHMFEQTLTGSARLWFNSLPAASINSFEDLQDGFETHFMHQRRYERDPVEIHNIKQRDQESALDFLKRFNKESMEIRGATESMRISGYMHAIRNKQLIEQLNRVIPKTMKEVEQRTRDYIRGKEAAALTDDYPRRDSKYSPSWKKDPPQRFRGGPQKASPVPWRQEEKGRNWPGASGGRKVNFTALLKTPCEILTNEVAAKKFVPPTTGKNMTGPTDRYCEYHQGTGHHTNDCFQLKRQIEQAVQSGELAHLIKNIKGGQARENKRMKVNMLSHFEVTKRPRPGVMEERIPWWTSAPLLFFTRDPHNLTPDALVVRGRIMETHVERILIDTGAGTGIIYRRFFKELPTRVRESMETTSTAIEAFDGRTTRPMGKIRLPITLGEYPHARTERLTFYVMNEDSSLDMIMGRPGLVAFQAVPSTIHGVLLFPTCVGVAEIKGTSNEETRYEHPTRRQVSMVDSHRPSPGWLNQEISFAAQDQCIPSDEALVIPARVKGIRTEKVLVDSGSSIEVMYDHFFQKIGPEDRRAMWDRGDVIEGFGGTTSRVEGSITLPLTLGSGAQSRTEQIRFCVVKAPSSYDLILGRPGLLQFRAVASTLHSQLKFPSPGGISSIRGEKKRNSCFAVRSTREVKKNKPEMIHDTSITLGNTLSPESRTKIEQLLRNFKDVFAWTPSDMTGISRDVAEHRLQVRKGVVPVRQKRRSMAPDRLEAIRAEVEKLVAAGILREVNYQTWVANPVMVPKSDGTWRMCIDFKDINKACPKDNYPLPEIDAKVDSLVGFKYKCFLDAYKGYHQIQMAEEDEEKTAFYTEHKLYCYKKMPFGLINAGATYQRLVDKVFRAQMGRNLEVYVDDLVIKSRSEDDLIRDIEETFLTLRKVNMKLNPKKCVFGAEEGKFLGHMITVEGIRACPDKVEAITKLRSPTTLKQVQSLNGKLAALSRYLSRLAERSLPFFKTLQRCISKNSFKWTNEAEDAFDKIKKHIVTLPLLTAPEEGGDLYLYLAASPETISSVLMTEKDKRQTPVFFVSKALAGAEVNYSPMEKLVLALVHSARRLRRYFQAYQIQVLTEMPIKDVLARPEKSGRLAKWAIELGEYNIMYKPRAAMKGQILADFIAETPIPGPPRIRETPQKDPEEKHSNRWTLYTDGASNIQGSGAGIVLVDPEGTEVTYSLKFDFKNTNNEAEYEALLAGIRIARRLRVEDIAIKVDSALVANQVTGEYATKDEGLAKYRMLVLRTLADFKTYSIDQIPRGENTKADAASKVASAVSTKLRKNQAPVEILKKRSIEAEEVHEITEEEGITWMNPIQEFLEKGVLPANVKEAKKVELRSLGYAIQDGLLYKKSYLMPLLRCVGPKQASYILREIHEGACSLHHGPRMMAAKVANLGYYWPSILRDAVDIAQKCLSCQRYAPAPHRPKEELNSMTSAWPFHKWGIDIVGPFPKAPGGAKFLVVAVDYFTKWVEAKPLAKITGAQVKNFIWDNIVCRFGLPGVLVSDNGKQFADNPVKRWCAEIDIKQNFTSVAHPQANGQVERINRSIVEGIKKRLDAAGGNWADHLTHVLWAHRTSPKTSNGMTPFSLTYGTEAVIPAEIGIRTKRTREVNEEENNEALQINLGDLEERREIAAIREENYKRKVEGYYNQKVRPQSFTQGEFVLRRNEASLAEPQGKLGPTWEGPYRVDEVMGKGAYKLEGMNGRKVPRTWNAVHLRKCYL